MVTQYTKEQYSLAKIAKSNGMSREQFEADILPKFDAGMIDAQGNYQDRSFLQRAGAETKEFFRDSGGILKDRFSRAHNNLLEWSNSSTQWTYLEALWSFGSNTLWAAWQVVRAGSDIIWEGIEGAFSSMVNDPNKRALGRYAEPKIQKVAEKLQPVVGRYTEFSDKNPNSAKAIWGAANLGLGFLDAVGLWATGSLVKTWTRSWKESLRKLAKEGIKTIDNSAEKVQNFAQGLQATGKYWDDVIAKISGMEKTTIDTIRKFPDLFEEVQRGNITRQTLMDDFWDSVGSLQKKISNTGWLYDDVRKNKALFKKGEVKGLVDDALKEQNISIGKDGAFDLSKTGLNSKDLTALKNALEQVDDVLQGNKFVRTNEVLNMRQKLDPLIAWNSEMTPDGQKVVKALRTKLRQVAHDRVPDLKQLDDTYSPLRQQLNQLRKDFFNKDGSLKDSASSKLTNITNKGREQLLDRLKELDPDIEAKTLAVKAFEDLDRASGNKVGAYASNLSSITGAVLAWPLWFAAAEVWSSPKVWSGLLKRYGRAKNHSANLQASLPKQSLQEPLGLGDEILQGVGTQLKQWSKITSLRNFLQAKLSQIDDKTIQEILDIAINAQTRDDFVKAIIGLGTPLTIDEIDEIWEAR